MLYRLRRHPLPISAFFTHSLVLTFAHPAKMVQGLVPLPTGLPFGNLEDTRRFAGPLPFTFGYERETNSIVTIKAPAVTGSRSRSMSRCERLGSSIIRPSTRLRRYWPMRSMWRTCPTDGSAASSSR